MTPALRDWAGGHSQTGPRTDSFTDSPTRIISRIKKLHRTAHRYLVTLSFPRVINFKFPLRPHQKYYITQYEELGLSSLTQMKDDYTTNSHYLTYVFLFKGWENVLAFWSETRGTVCFFRA